MFSYQKILSIDVVTLKLSDGINQLKDFISIAMTITEFYSEYGIIKNTCTVKISIVRGFFDRI